MPTENGPTQKDIDIALNRLCAPERLCIAGATGEKVVAQLITPRDSRDGMVMSAAVSVVEKIAQQTGQKISVQSWGPVEGVLGLSMESKDYDRVVEQLSGVKDAARKARSLNFDTSDGRDKAQENLRQQIEAGLASKGWRL
jgi:hypothetical protein